MFGVEIDFAPHLGTQLPFASWLRLFDVPEASGMEQVAAAACRRLDTMDFVGITEQLDAAAVLLCDQLGIEPPASLPRKRIAPERERAGLQPYRGSEGFSPELIAKIDALNVYDRRIYEHARTLFERRAADWERGRRPLPRRAAAPARHPAPAARSRVVVAPVRTPPPFYLLHMHKTGGTTLNSLLEAAYPPEMRLLVWGLDELASLTPETINRYRCFAGHFGTALFSVLDKPVACMTMVRDPFERTVSQIRYWRRKRKLGSLRRLTGGDSARALKILRGDIRVALADADLVAHLQDYQTRSLGLSLDVSRLRRRPVGELEFQEVLRREADGVDPAALVEAAMQRLDTLEIVGITEEFDASAQLLADFVGVALPAPLAPLRVSPEKSALGPRSYREAGGLSEDLIDAIDKLTANDRRIYEHARSVFERRRARAQPRPSRERRPAEWLAENRRAPIVITTHGDSSRPEATSARPAVYLVHVNKTAGSSLGGFLRGRYAAEECFPAYTVKQLRGFTCAQINGFRCFTGHFGPGLLSLLDRPVLCVTLLRDPLRADPLADPGLATAADRSIALVHRRRAERARSDPRGRDPGGARRRRLRGDARGLPDAVPGSGIRLRMRCSNRPSRSICPRRWCARRAARECSGSPSRPRPSWTRSTSWASRRSSRNPGGASAPRSECRRPSPGPGSASPRRGKPWAPPAIARRSRKKSSSAWMP